MEIWKDVTGYEGIYEVSNTGKVRTKEGKTTFSSLHGKRVWKSRELKQKTDKDGYKRVELYKDKNHKTALVHRLVAIEFCQKSDSKNLVNHKDGNPSNNNADNLEWCDHKHNLMHAYLTGLNKAPIKVSLTNKSAGFQKEFYSMAEASRFLGRNQGYISGVLKRGRNEADGYIIKLEA